MPYSVVVFGCTGLVGKELLHLLETREFPIHQLTLVASSKSVDDMMIWNKQEYTICSPEDSLLNTDVDLVFFCASSALSSFYTPQYLELNKHVVVIDNSKCWRMCDDVSIVIPPINGECMKNMRSRIIANSNCTTAGLALFLHPIQDDVKEVHVVSIQSCSGSGYKGIYQLKDERDRVLQPRRCYSRPIYDNLIPLIGEVKENGYSDEEWKMMRETNKILGTDIPITATCIRGPLVRGHSLVVTATLHPHSSLELEELERRWENQDGLVYSRNVVTPRETIRKLDVYVSRVRYHQRVLTAFVTFDNLYRGASWNSVEIGEGVTRV